MGSLLGLFHSRTKKTLNAPRPNSIYVIHLDSMIPHGEMMGSKETSDISLGTSLISFLKKHSIRYYRYWWFQPLWKIWKSAGVIIPNVWTTKQTSIYKDKDNHSITNIGIRWYSDILTDTLVLVISHSIRYWFTHSITNIIHPHSMFGCKSTRPRFLGVLDGGFLKF